MNDALQGFRPVVLSWLGTGTGLVLENIDRLASISVLLITFVYTLYKFYYAIKEQREKKNEAK